MCLYEHAHVGLNLPLGERVLPAGANRPSSASVNAGCTGADTSLSEPERTLRRLDNCAGGDYMSLQFKRAKSFPVLHHCAVTWNLFGLPTITRLQRRHIVKRPRVTSTATSSLGRSFIHEL
jgi:hypothetical protein